MSFFSKILKVKKGSCTWPPWTWKKWLNCRCGRSAEPTLKATCNTGGKISKHRAGVIPVITMQLCETQAIMFLSSTFESTFNVLLLEIFEFKLNGSLEKFPQLHSVGTVLVHLRWAVPVNPYLRHKRVTTWGSDYCLACLMVFTDST